MDNDELDISLQLAKEGMDGAMGRLRKQLSKISAGKANPNLVKDLLVDYYGTPTPLSQVANINAVDSRTIAIQPWEKVMLAPIEKSIFEANLGLTPMNDGEFVRINIPALTGDRRKQLVKQAKSLGEDAKVSIRSERQKAMSAIKDAVKNGFPEDAGKKTELAVEDDVKQFYKSIETYLTSKEADIMKV